MIPSVAGDWRISALVDAHHHLIGLEEVRYPWIERRRPELEALLANYYAIAREYRPGDYLADVSRARSGRSVACEFGAADGVAEAEWIQRCATDSGCPDGFIAAVDLRSSSVSDVLAQYQELPIVRAVRQPLYWADEPLRRLGEASNFLSDSGWLRGFEQVAERGFAWDLLVYDHQLPDTHKLIGEFPQTRFVLEAAGWPLDQSPDGLKRWQERLEAISAFPNVTLKLQGLALIFGASPDAITPWVRSALRIFGANRCMFASHFPVDRLLWSFDALLAALEPALEGLNIEQRDSFLGGCATEVYQLT